MKSEISVANTSHCEEKSWGATSPANAAPLSAPRDSPIDTKEQRLIHEPRPLDGNLHHYQEQWSEFAGAPDSADSNCEPYTEAELELIRNPTTYKQKRFRLEKHRGLSATPGPNTFVMVLDHLKPGFNIGKTYRTVQAFGGHSVHVVGTPYFDPNPAKGALKHVPSQFHKTFDSSYQVLFDQGYSFFVLDPHQGWPLWDVSFPQKSAFIMGNEQHGIQFDPQRYARMNFIRIPQNGSMESLNVSVAASIVIYEYLRQQSSTVRQQSKIERQRVTGTERQRVTGTERKSISNLPHP